MAALSCRAYHLTTWLTPMPYCNNKQRSRFFQFCLVLPTTKILSDVILEGNWSPFYFLSSMFVNNLSEGPTKPNKQDGDDFGARNLSPKRTTSPIWSHSAKFFFKFFLFLKNLYPSFSQKLILEFCYIVVLTFCRNDNRIICQFKPWLYANFNNIMSRIRL